MSENVMTSNMFGIFTSEIELSTGQYWNLKKNKKKNFSFILIFYSPIVIILSKALGAILESPNRILLSSLCKQTFIKKK